MTKLLSIAILLGFSINSAFAAPITLKLAHDLDRNHSVSKAFEYFAKDVATLSNNEIKIRIYGNGQMGSARETMELLLEGGLDMTKGSSNLESFADIYKVFSLPYLFKDKKHHDAVVYGPIGRDIMNSTKDKGFFALSAYDTGTRSFYSNKEIINPKDLKGIKVRVQPSQTSIKMVELMGGSPTPVSFSEIYTALQQGIIDGAENNIPTWVNARHIELVKVYSEDQHTSVPDFLVISTKRWNSLTPQQQEIITKAARDSELWHGKLWAQEMEQARKDAVKLGGKIVKSNKEEFKKLVKPIYDEYRKNPENAKLLDEIENASK
ncbi:Neu5Ac-binding protein [Gallibacterium anatis]|uniref:Neu5Ac-binding protein n=1 Tax=Gallibacterium anatis TaxID=750 RepID=A0A377H7U6_9PAST|nr:TRAP transporter substrate-binding protein [Gallibacterium anatis]KGQ59260.1 hypothetical protein IE01_00485 [Gallibacterium anatis DSM 16844 = F 149]STO38591.1 Neu5Ac-binding protein [Gallibacterium anatis]